MSDPLSVFVSCAGILKVIATVIQRIFNFAGQVRKAENDLRRIRRQLESLSDILSSLSKTDQAVGFHNMPEIKAMLEPAIASCGSIVKEMGRLLKNMSKGSVSGKTKWVSAGKERMSNLQSNLESQKANLAIVLTSIGK